MQKVLCELKLFFQNKIFVGIKKSYLIFLFQEIEPYFSTRKNN